MSPEMTEDEAKVLGGRPEDASLSQLSETSPDAVDLEGSSRGVSVDTGEVRVQLPIGLKDDIELIVVYLKRWKTIAEFVRFALLNEVKRWIREALRKKKEAESE